jgi:hypothetical protein
MPEKKSKKDKGKGKQQYFEVSDDSGADDSGEGGLNTEDEDMDEEKNTENETDQEVEKREGVKFGPPKKKPPPLANRGESSSPIAGPSNSKKGKQPKPSSKSMPIIGNKVRIK